jgi:ankyrin repeat protein
MSYNEIMEQMVTNRDDRDFVSAAADDDVEKVNNFLCSGEHIDAQGVRGWTALRIAAYRNHYGMVKFLLEHGASIDERNMTGHTALMVASVYGYMEITRLLLEYGADSNVTTVNGSTALMDAAQHGHVEIVKELLTKGADPCIANKRGATALTLAIEHGSADIVRALIEHEATRHSLTCWDTIVGDTPLVLAKKTFHDEIAKILSEAGIN